jgi:ABC-type sugar transport system ATPase subunit
MDGVSRLCAAVCEAVVGQVAAHVDGQAPLLSVSGLSKTFPGLKALDSVGLRVRSGEILAVVGHNGSGKSTLVKILAGVHRPDPGAEVEVRDGDGEVLSGPAARMRLHFIHQDLGLVEMLSAVENLSLGAAQGRRSLLPPRRTAERERAERLIARFGARFDVTAAVSGLSPAERAIVAIARALDGWQGPDNVLVLDEPTTAFHEGEVKRLFAAIRRVAQSGAGVVFISHRLDEVLELANRVVVLRDGRVVADEDAARLDHDRMVGLIAGRTVAAPAIGDETGEREPVLEVRGLGGGKIRELGFALRAGEVLGVSGILGSGREELSGLLFGTRHRLRGTVTLSGRPLPSGDMVAAIDGRMGFVPADRRRHGAVMDMNVRENLTLPLMAPLRRRFARLDGRAEREETHRWIRTVALSPPDPERPLRLLSGGNQQKVVLAKWLRTQPRVLLLDEPTQGVDVGAKAMIYELILKAKRSGAGVVVCSSDSKELVALCDRVLVLEQGRLASEIPRRLLSEERLVREQLGLGSADGAGGHHAESEEIEDA